MPGATHTYGTFEISQEGSNYIARDLSGADDGGYLEIQSDSLDTLKIAMDQVVEHGLQPYVPGKPAPMPAWYQPFAIEGDVSRIVLPSRDLKRLFEMTSRQAGQVIGALVGSTVAVAIWTVVTISTHPLLVDIGESARHFL